MHQSSLALKGGCRLKYVCDKCEETLIKEKNSNQNNEMDIHTAIKELIKLVKEQSEKINKLEKVWRN